MVAFFFYTHLFLVDRRKALNCLNNHISITFFIILTILKLKLTDMESTIVLLMMCVGTMTLYGFLRSINGSRNSH